MELRVGRVRTWFSRNRLPLGILTFVLAASFGAYILGRTWTATLITDPSKCRDCPPCGLIGPNTASIALPPSKWAKPDYLRDFSTADTGGKPVKQQDTSLIDVAREVAAMVERRAIAVSSHVNNEHDTLLDDPTLPPECRKMLENPNLYEYCWSGHDCSAQEPFQAQFGQDFLYYHNFLRNTDKARRGNGFYVDVGAFQPRVISNTYFLDHCLGWKGICIEANPGNRRAWKNSGRTCKMIGKCVSDKKESLSMSGDLSMTQFGNEGKIQVECDSLESILREEGVTHVDFMSLDVEGSETKVLSSTSLHQFKIDLVAVEVNHQPIVFDTLFFRQGYTKVTEVEIDDFYMRGIPWLVSEQNGKYHYSRNGREPGWPPSP